MAQSPSGNQQLANLWVARADPYGRDARGADNQAQYIAEAQTRDAPGVYVCRADDVRQATHSGDELDVANILDIRGNERTVRFEVEVLHPEVDDVATPNPLVTVRLHVGTSDRDPAESEFHHCIEGFLNSVAFAEAIAEYLPASVSAKAGVRRPLLSQLFTVQSLFLLDSPHWNLPFGRGGKQLDRHDIVFHIPLDGAPKHLQWVTKTRNLLAGHIAAYQGRVSFTQTLMCFSKYTASLAESLGIPSFRICQFPVALLPGRIHVVERNVDYQSGERIAWAAPVNAPEKGLLYLVDVLQTVNGQLVAEGRRIALDVFGHKPEPGVDPAFDALYASVYEPLVEQGILTFHGFAPDDVRNEYIASNVRVSVNSSTPSAEGLGMFSIELVKAAGCGYATRPGGGAEDAAGLVDKAYVAGEDSPEALASAIIAALNYEQMMLREHGSNWRHELREGAIVSFREVADHINSFIAHIVSTHAPNVRHHNGVDQGLA